MDIRGLITYTDNCRRLLHATLQAHPDALHAPFETLGAYKSVAQLVAHMVGAEERWTVQRLWSEERPQRYEERAAQTLNQLFFDWEAIRARLRAFIESTHDPSHPSGLHRPIEFYLPQWERAGILTAEEILFHIFNHQTYHLGQVSMALQQQGIDPPNFDYCLLGKSQ